LFLCAVKMQSVAVIFKLDFFIISSKKSSLKKAYLFLCAVKMQKKLGLSFAKFLITIF
jgi:hypothetical protein